MGPITRGSQTMGPSFRDDGSQSCLVVGSQGKSLGLIFFFYIAGFFGLDIQMVQIKYLDMVARGELSRCLQYQLIPQKILGGHNGDRKMISHSYKFSKKFVYHYCIMTIFKCGS